jgi:hypothetical protein
MYSFLSILLWDPKTSSRNSSLSSSSLSSSNFWPYSAFSSFDPPVS